ncbi:MAG: MoxR family ATPase [Candidatus Aminicenantaceae bacterium]
MSDLQNTADSIIEQLERIIFGKREVLQMVLVCLLAEGHLLMEDVPGTAKTLLGKALARTLGGTFRRLQCTPDLLPGDITGINVFNLKTSEFEFHPGPVMTQILLTDEINRATPRAQAALLECMAERQVSVENQTYSLERPFFVIATQNPIEHEGTFALPEAQLDRFLMRLSMGYPSQAAEKLMLEASVNDDPLSLIEQVLDLEAIKRFQDQIRKVHVIPRIQEYIIQIVASTRSHKDFLLGGSPRATKGLFRSAQALAAISGRDFVLPDDVKRLYPAVLNHRVILSVEGRLQKRSVQQALEDAVGMIPAPIIQPEALIREL